ncbi:hypothetical protein HDU76_004137 [Blyttiomyces sp. JEL0837]|nr:hypothetical protein HDU76_004137 [Blyttiomyces sp. JEL0837]
MANGMVTEPTADHPTPIDERAWFRWTNGDPTNPVWNLVQGSTYFPTYIHFIVLTPVDPNLPNAAPSVSIPQYTLKVGEKLGDLTEIQIDGALAAYPGMAPGLWKVTIDHSCQWTQEQMKKYCPGSPCLPCSGFFPTPAVGTMSVLPPSASPTVVPTTNSGNGGIQMNTQTTNSVNSNPTTNGGGGDSGSHSQPTSSGPSQQATGTDTSSATSIRTVTISGVVTTITPSPATDQNTTSSSSTSNASSASIPLISGVVAGVVVLLAIIGSILFFGLKKRKDEVKRQLDIDTEANRFTDIDLVKEVFVNGVEENDHNMRISVGREEMDLFATQTGVAPPPSYDHVAAVNVSRSGTVGRVSGSELHALVGNAGATYSKDGSSLFGGNGSTNDYTIDAEKQSQLFNNGGSANGLDMVGIKKDGGGNLGPQSSIKKAKIVRKD